MKSDIYHVLESQNDNEKVKGIHMDITINFSMKLLGKSIHVESKMDTLINNNPYISRINMLNTMGKSDSEKLILFFFNENKTYYMYVKKNDKWEEKIGDKRPYDTKNSLCSPLELAEYLSRSKQLKTVEKKELTDPDFVIMEGMVTKDIIVKIMGATMLLDSLLFIIEEETSSFEDLHYIGMTSLKIWIDKDSRALVKVSMDLGKMIEHMIKKEAKGLTILGGKVQNFMVDINYRPSDQVEKLKKEGIKKRL